VYHGIAGYDDRRIKGFSTEIPLRCESRRMLFLTYARFQAQFPGA